MLFVFGKFTFAKMSKSVMLVVLTEVETHTLALYAHTHRYELVDKPIAKVAHAECVDKHYHNGKNMVEEYHQTVGSSGNKAFVNKDTGHYRTYNTARSVGREHIKRIVNPAVRTPVYRNVANY